MARFRIKLKNPRKLLQGRIKQAWDKTLSDLEFWIRNQLIQALTFGGMGIQGIAQTDFYRFITSNDGLSQLGIPASEPPKLLKAYETSAFSIGRRGRTLRFLFGRINKLKQATPYPNVASLQVTSWMEWVIDRKSLTTKGFVPRSNLPPPAQKRIRLQPPLGGLMLRRGLFGSTGMWQFPTSLVDYDVRWFKQNEQLIVNAVSKKIRELFNKHLNG